MYNRRLSNDKTFEFEIENKLEIRNLCLWIRTYNRRSIVDKTFEIANNLGISNLYLWILFPFSSSEYEYEHI